MVPAKRPDAPDRGRRRLGQDAEPGGDPAQAFGARIEWRAVRVRVQIGRKQNFFTREGAQLEEQHERFSQKIGGIVTGTGQARKAAGAETDLMPPRTPPATAPWPPL
jgi:hypothetical protein